MKKGWGTKEDGSAVRQSGTGGLPEAGDQAVGGRGALVCTRMEGIAGTVWEGAG